MSTLERHIVVIGGGVIGLTTAIRLLECSPHARVTVLEQNAVGSGASRYAGAIDIPYFQSQFHRQLVSFSWKWYAGFAPAAAHRLPVPIQWFLSSPADEDELRLKLNQHAAPVGAAGQGWTAPPAIHAIEGEAFVLRPEPWCQVLKQQLDTSGRATVLEQHAVTNLALRNGKVEAVTAAATICADHAIVCMGPWLPAWIAPVTLWAQQQKVRIKKVFGLQVEISSSARRWCAIGWVDAGIFFLPYGRTGNYFMSVRHEEWDVTPDQPGTMVPEVAMRAATFLDQIVGPGEWRIIAPSVFMDTYNTAFQPVVEQLGEMDNRVTVITGTHGSGVRLAPGLADLAARACLHGAH